MKLNINISHLHKLYIFTTFAIFYTSAIFATDVDSGKLSITEIDLIDNAELRNTIINYYTAESEKNWATTYNLKSISFKEDISFEHYKNKMEEADRGWNLTKIEIRDITAHSDNLFQVDIGYVEKVNVEEMNGDFAKDFHRIYKKTSFYDSTNNTFTADTFTLWMLEDNKWFPIGSSGRMHISIFLTTDENQELNELIKRINKEHHDHVRRSIRVFAAE